MDYDRRHVPRRRAYDRPARMKAANRDNGRTLARTPDYDDMLAAIVAGGRAAAPSPVTYGETSPQISGEGLRFASDRMLGDKAPPTNASARRRDRIAPATKTTGRSPSCPKWRRPRRRRPATGAIRAHWPGGFDFSRNKFNHVTQAWRQPGSSFKPFIYSAAFERAMAQTGVVDDSPLVLPGGRDRQPGLGAEELRRPLRRPRSPCAPLAARRTWCRSACSSRSARATPRTTSPSSASTPERHRPTHHGPRRGLGHPWQMLRGCAVFANGGYRIEPYLVKEIPRRRRQRAGPRRPAGGRREPPSAPSAGATPPDGFDRKDVVRRGTATKTMVLKRGDLAGKTGTTNDLRRRAWFCGCQPTLVAVAWIGSTSRATSAAAGPAAATPPCRCGSTTCARPSTACRRLPEGTPEGLIRDPAGRQPPPREMIYKENLPAVPVDALSKPPRAPADRSPSPPAADEAAPACRRPPPAERQRAGAPSALQADRLPGLLRHAAGQHHIEILPVRVPTPAPSAGRKWKPPGFRRQPDLPGRRVAIDDDLAAVVELQLQHAAGLHLVVSRSQSSSKPSRRSSSASASALNPASSIAHSLPSVNIHVFAWKSCEPSPLPPRPAA